MYLYTYTKVYHKPFTLIIDIIHFLLNILCSCFVIFNYNIKPLLGNFDGNICTSGPFSTYNLWQWSKKAWCGRCTSSFGKLEQPNKSVIIPV